jgi:SpoVK/Ycf46/Vps4 family AAA+-type ATPase
MKASLIEDVYGFFDAQALYKELGVPWKRGVIFHGVPGNGKTISIKALMGALHNRPYPIPSLYVKSFENCNGPQASVSAIFAQARASAPCLLVFEDLDSLVQDETRSYFLNEVDGLESNDGILMIGSTNHLEALDPAISKRPSRFDRKYHYKIPGIAEREAYAAYWRQKLEQTGSGRVDFPEGVGGVVAALTEGFSFAYLKELFVMALLTIARGGVGEDLDGEEIGEEIENQETSAVEHCNPWVEEKKEEKPEETTCVSCKALTKLIAKDAEKQQEKKEPKKHTMPQVEIPQELRDIILLKVIKHQIKILLLEMDNTADDERPSGNARPKQKKARCPPKPLRRC